MEGTCFGTQNSKLLHFLLEQRQNDVVLGKRQNQLFVFPLGVHTCHTCYRCAVPLRKINTHTHTCTHTYTHTHWARTNEHRTCTHSHRKHTHKTHTLRTHTHTHTHTLAIETHSFALIITTCEHLAPEQTNRCQQKRRTCPGLNIGSTDPKPQKTRSSPAGAKGTWFWPTGKSLSLVLFF